MTSAIAALRREFDAKLDGLRLSLRDEILAELRSTQQQAPLNDARGSQALLNDGPESDDTELHGRRRLSAFVRNTTVAHHEWFDSVLYQFEDATQCLKGDGAFTMIIPGQTDATYNQIEIYSREDEVTPKHTHEPPFIVHLRGNCSSTPTLHTVLPLIVESSVELNGQDLNTRLNGIEARLNGIDLVNQAQDTRLRNTGPLLDAFGWSVNTANGVMQNHKLWRWAHKTEAAYLELAITKEPIISIVAERGPNHGMGHALLGLQSNPAGTNTFHVATSVYLWLRSTITNDNEGVRSGCPPVAPASSGEIFHGTDTLGSGSSYPPDDNLLTDSDPGDMFSITLNGTTATFWASKHDGGTTPFRTCTVPSGSYFGRVFGYSAGQGQALPLVKYA